MILFLWTRLILIGKWIPPGKMIPPSYFDILAFKNYCCAFVERYFPIVYILCYYSSFGSLLTKKLHGTFKFVMTAYTIVSVS